MSIQNFDLGYEHKDGSVKKFQSSEWRVCLRCGIPINESNDSGWELFTSTPGLSAPACKGCFNPDKKPEPDQGSIVYPINA